MIANKDKDDRSKLVLYMTEKGTFTFTKSMLLMDCKNSIHNISRCHYPAAVEHDGKLYIIATADYKGDVIYGRGAVLFTVDLK